VSRFKIMADMDIAESRKPQDGHCGLTVNGHKLDFRVSTLPTVYGERVVLRVAPSGIFARLAEHERVVAVKDASGDVYGAASSIARTGLAWYSGDDSAYLALLAHGAAGVVSVVGHVAGRRLAELTAAFDAGDHARALQIFLSIVPAIDALNGAGFQAVFAKAAVEALGLIPNRHMRLPYVAASDDDVVTLRAGLRAAGLLDVVSS